MKDAIIVSIKKLTAARINREPNRPNELDVCNEIHSLFRKELESLINEGHVKVVGKDFRSKRILSI